VGDRIIELLYRNLQEVFGEGDAGRRRAAIEDFYTEDCVLYVPPGVFVGHDALDKFGETSARHIPTSSIRLMESHEPCTTEGFSHGAQARKARHQSIPDWMSSLFAMVRSLRSTSFSIPNLHRRNHARIFNSRTLRPRAKIIREPRLVFRMSGVTCRARR
jgi:hypothetical protein